jgi:hypothetical protein
MNSAPAAEAVSVPMATYTSVWKIERKLYKIHDVDLPRPVAISEAAAYVGFALVSFAVLSWVGVAFDQYTGWLFIVPPLVATWYVRRPVADAKTIPAYLATLARYALEPKVLDGLRPRRDADSTCLTARIRTPGPQRVVGPDQMSIRESA